MKISALKSQKHTVSNMTQFYDSLEEVQPSFMFGIWKGHEIDTGHRMNGLLQTLGWFGKQFIDEETVHPLVFNRLISKGTYCVNPALVPLNIDFPKNKISTILLSIVSPIISTKKPCARLRRTVHRNKTSATMIYDSKPINDHFRKIDSNTVLGFMDMKKEEPFFFLLERT